MEIFTQRTLNKLLLEMQRNLISHHPLSLAKVLHLEDPYFRSSLQEASLISDFGMENIKQINNRALQNEDFIDKFILLMIYTFWHK